MKVIPVDKYEAIMTKVIDGLQIKTDNQHETTKKVMYQSVIDALKLNRVFVLALQEDWHCAKCEQPQQVKEK